MDQSAEHLREISNTLYKYHVDNFLCDVFVVTPDGHEVPAHSVVLSTVSMKLRAAFEKSDSSVKKNYIFKLHVTDCDVPTVETVLQFVYTGAIAVTPNVPLDITRILSAGQKLGLDSTKLASCLSALLCLADSSVVESLPPVILTDEDLCLEIVEKCIMSEIAAVVFKRQDGAEVAATTVANANVPDKVDKVILKASAKKLMISFASSRKVSNKTASITKGGHLLKAFVKTEGTCSDQSVGGTVVVDGEKSATCEVGGSDSSGTQFETSSTTTKQKLKKQNVQLRMDYVCDDCNECFATNSELKKHKRSHKKPENRCDVCDISFADDFERMHHKQTHRDRIPCPECDKSFTLERSLRDHMATYHSNVEVEKPFECDICGHRFVRANLAAIHRRTHTGERPFQCEQCGRGFICRGDLNKHTRLHVYGYIYKCSVCGKELKTSRESADHKRMHSSGINCPICGKSFTRYQNMQAHVRGTHDGERRFQCDLCPKAFVYAQNLRCHKRQHQPDQSLTCNVCDETLTSPGDLLQHTAQHRDLPKPDMDLELSAGSDPVNLDTDSSSSDVRQSASSDL